MFLMTKKMQTAMHLPNCYTTISRVGHEVEQAWQNLCSSVTCPDRISLQTPHWGGRLRLINVKNHNYNEDDLENCTLQCWVKISLHENYLLRREVISKVFRQLTPSPWAEIQPVSWIAGHHLQVHLYVRNINASVKNALNFEHSFESCFYRIWTWRSSSERWWTLIFWCWVNRH